MYLHLHFLGFMFPLWVKVKGLLPKMIVMYFTDEIFSQFLQILGHNFPKLGQGLFQKEPRKGL